MSGKLQFAAVSQSSLIFQNTFQDSVKSYHKSGLDLVSTSCTRSYTTNNKSKQNQKYEKIEHKTTYLVPTETSISTTEIGQRLQFFLYEIYRQAANNCDAEKRLSHDKIFSYFVLLWRMIGYYCDQSNTYMHAQD